MNERAHARRCEHEGCSRLTTAALCAVHAHRDQHRQHRQHRQERQDGTPAGSAEVAETARLLHERCEGGE